MRRLFCDTIPDVGNIAELSTEESKHLRTVLRNAGGEVELLDGNGKRAIATVERGPNQRNACVRIMSNTTDDPPTLKIHLYVAPPRAKIMSQLVRQATELGVWAICPIISDRSVSTPSGEPASWTAQAKEALKQSGNSWLPKMQAPVSFAEAAAQAPSGWYGAPAYTNPSSEIHPAKSHNQAIWIGPEGGFSTSETAKLQQIATPLSIGPHVLRIETACIAMLAAVHCLNGTPA